MTIQDLGSIGEVVAAAATIATLAYLALQIRQDTRALKIQALQYVIDSKLSAFQGFTAEGRDGEIFQRGCASYEALPPEEQLRFSTLMGRLFSTCEYVLTAHRDGFIKTGTYAAAQRDVAWALNEPLWTRRSASPLTKRSSFR